MTATFDPYYKWLAIPPSEQPPNYYRLLALAVFESDADVIATAADQRMSHLRSFQGGQYVDASQRLLNEIAAARICLLRPDKKAAYDAALRAKLEKQKPQVPPPPTATQSPPRFASPIEDPPAPVGRDSGYFSPPPREKLLDLPALKEPPPVAPPSRSARNEPELDLLPDEPVRLRISSHESLLNDLADDLPLDTFGDKPVEIHPDELTPAQLAAAKALAKQAEAEKLPQRKPPVKLIGAGANTIKPPQADGQPDSELRLEGDPLDVVDEMDRYSSHSTLRRRRRTTIPKFVLLAPLASILVVIGAALYSTFRDTFDSDNGKNVGQIAAQTPHPSNRSLPAAPPAAKPPENPAPEPTKVATGFGSAPPNDPSLNAFGLPMSQTLPGNNQTLTNPSNLKNPVDQTPLAKQSSGRTSIPDSEAQRKAFAEIRKVYREEYIKAVTIDGRKALAQKLTDEAANTKDGLERYILTTQALDAAVQLCNVDMASRLVYDLCNDYEVDDWLLKAKTLSQLAATAKSPENRLLIAVDAYSLVDRALSEKRYDVAVDLSATAAEMAATLRDTVLRQKTFEAHARARRMQKESSDMQAAQGKLATNPDDPDANLTVGRFLCFEQDDWDAGLPLLAKSSDRELSELAERDQSVSTQAADQFAIADDWWNLADKRNGTGDSQLTKGMRARAVYWYQRVKADLSGFDATKAEKRIEEFQGAPAPTAK